MPNYEEIALKIVPRSNQRTVSQMRKDIASWLEHEVKFATERQREQEFPELGKVREEQEVKKKELEKKLAECQKWENQLQERQRDQEQKEANLQALLKAFDGWIGWMNGDGAVDENAKRFDALRTAYHKFKGDRK